MINNLFFLGIHLGIFWVMYWAWQQDSQEERNEQAGD